MFLKQKSKALTGFAIISFIFISAIASFAGTINYTYDDLNRLERVEYEDGTTIEYFFDEVGNRTQKVISILPPKISVSPTSYDFGSVFVGATSAPTTFTISNTGGSDLLISSVVLAHTNADQFVIQSDTCSGQSVAALGACTVDVVFASTVVSLAGRIEH